MSRARVRAHRPTRWELHQRKWGKGCGSDACKTAGRICLAKGSLPCDVFFCGEAPGPSENVLGVPFCGPAGQLLNIIIGRASVLLASPLRLAFGNLVGCIPLDEDGAKFHEPPDDQVKQCGPRLAELVAIAAPRLLVCVGKLAFEWLDPDYKHRIKLERQLDFAGRGQQVGRLSSRSGNSGEGNGERPVLRAVRIVHPAAILRAPIAARSLMAARSVAVLRAAFEELAEQGKEN